MKNVLIDAEIDHQELARLEATPGVHVDTLDPVEGERILPTELLQNTHVLLREYPPANFSEMVSLEFVQITSSGYSQLHGLDLPARKIRACKARYPCQRWRFEWPWTTWNSKSRNARSTAKSVLTTHCFSPTSSS